VLQVSSMLLAFIGWFAALAIVHMTLALAGSPA
jgi:hypothetical protein